MSSKSRGRHSESGRERGSAPNSGGQSLFDVSGLNDDDDVEGNDKRGKDDKDNDDDDDDGEIPNASGTQSDDNTAKSSSSFSSSSSSDNSDSTNKNHLPNSREMNEAEKPSTAAGIQGGNSGDTGLGQGRNVGSNRGYMLSRNFDRNRDRSRGFVNPSRGRSGNPNSNAKTPGDVRNGRRTRKTKRSTKPIRGAKQVIIYIIL